jgi:hypothetical protein
MDSLCAIIVLIIVFNMTTSSLYPTPTIKAPQSSRSLQTQIQSQRRAPIGRWERTNIEDTEYPFEHGEVINYTLDGVPVTAKIQVSFQTHLPERKEWWPMVTLKQLQSLMAVIGENGRWINNIGVIPQY